MELCDTTENGLLSLALSDSIVSSCFIWLLFKCHIILTSLSLTYWTGISNLMQVSLSLLAGLQRGRRWRFPTEEMWRTPFVTCWGGCAPPALTWAQPSSKSWAREPLSSASHNRPAKCSLSREHTRTHARRSHCSISSCLSQDYLSITFALKPFPRNIPTLPSAQPGNRRAVTFTNDADFISERAGVNALQRPQAGVFLGSC